MIIDRNGNFPIIDLCFPDYRIKRTGKHSGNFRTGELDLKLKLAPGKQYTLYPLRSDGFRRKGIPLKTKDGITEINLDTAKLPNGPAFYFELEGKQ